MRRYRIYGSLLLSAFVAINILPGQTLAAETTQTSSQVEITAATEEQPMIQQKTTGIVLLGSSRYLEPAYLDIMNRFFIKCYSQYRYPTEFGEDMQDKCQQAMESEHLSSLHNVSEKQLTSLVKNMDKDQVLFVHVGDMVHSKRRRIDRWLGAEEVWEANITLDVLLVGRDNVLRREKFYSYSDEQYSPERALGQAYTDCIRKLQRKNIFQEK